MISLISSAIIPLMVLLIIIYGIQKKVNVYDTFIEGAKESFPIVINLFPTILAMVLGVNIFLKSGVLNYILNLFGFLFKTLHIPLEIVPMALMRPISGNSALAILNNIFETNGPDSLIGRIASIIQGSTDTTFYIISLYFGSIGIKKIKYSLWAGLFADLVGIICAIIFANILFS